MFKINKCTKLTRCFPQLRRLRHSCEKECPPRYECKQPQPSDFEQTLERIKEVKKPLIFKPVCPKDYRIYKNIFYFVCLPVIICINLNMFYLHPEEPKRPKFLPFTYLRIRNKGYPWDPVRSLFHNPRVNALPDGYEEEVPEDEEYDPFEGDK